MQMIPLSLETLDEIIEMEPRWAAVQYREQDVVLFSPSLAYQIASGIMSEP